MSILLDLSLTKYQRAAEKLVTLTVREEIDRAIADLPPEIRQFAQIGCFLADTSTYNPAATEEARDGAIHTFDEASNAERKELYERILALPNMQLVLAGLGFLYCEIFYQRVTEQSPFPTDDAENTEGVSKVLAHVEGIVRTGFKYWTISELLEMAENLFIDFRASSGSSQIVYALALYSTMLAASKKLSGDWPEGIDQEERQSQQAEASAN